MARRTRRNPRGTTVVGFEVNYANQLSFGTWSSTYAFTDGVSTGGITRDDLVIIVGRLNDPQSEITDDGVRVHNVPHYIKSLKQASDSFIRFLQQIKSSHDHRLWIDVDDDKELWIGDLISEFDAEFKYNPCPPLS